MCIRDSIQEGALGRFRGWASLGTPQEGHYLPPGAGLLRHKVGTVYAGSNPGIDSPQDRRIVVPSFFNVHKRVWPGTNGFGPVFVAPGADIGLYTGFGRCGRCGHPAFVPAVASGVYITVHIGVSADRAGVGGVALLGTGGGCDQFPILVR